MRKIPLLLSVALAASSPLVGQVAEAKPKPKPVKHGYVVDSVQVPVSSSQARDLGLDVNGDGTADNRLGQVLGTLASQGFDVQGMVNTAVSSGALVTLLSVKTKSLKNAKGVRVRLFRGLPVANPDFSGGSFAVDSSSPRSELKAKVKDKALISKPGDVHVFMPGLLPGRPAVSFDLRGARILATCNGKRCINGRIGGGVPVEQLDERFVPEVGAAARAVVARDCPTLPDPCTPGSMGQTMLSLFDANHDNAITDQEIRDNPLMKALLAPDLDLVGGDGVADSVSFGFAFTAGRADISGD